MQFLIFYLYLDDDNNDNDGSDGKMNKFDCEVVSNIVWKVLQFLIFLFYI